MSNRHLPNPDRALIDRIAHLEAEVARMRSLQRWNGRRVQVVEQLSAPATMPGGVLAFPMLAAILNGPLFPVIQCSPGSWLLLAQFIINDNATWPAPPPPYGTYAQVGFYAQAPNQVLRSASYFNVRDVDGTDHIQLHTLVGTANLETETALWVVGEGYLWDTSPYAGYSLVEQAVLVAVPI